ncbi:hypothetical protein BG011_002611, partial [Mortierella polycephala]
KADPSKPTSTSVPTAPVSSNPTSQPQAVVPTGGIDATAMGSSQSFESQRSMTEDGKIGQLGNLTIRVIEADGLLGVDKSGTSDPYVKVKVGSQQVMKTKTKKETLTPNWSESIVVPGLTDQSMMLNFSVKDYNAIGNNTDLGECEFSLSDYILSNQYRADLWVSLGDSRGRLHIALEFEPTGEMNGRQDSKRSLFGRK